MDHTFKEESVVGITGRMLLGLEESIKVPERRLDVLVGGHLLETNQLDEQGISITLTFSWVNEKNNKKTTYPSSKKILRNSSRTFMRG